MRLSDLSAPVHKADFTITYTQDNKEFEVTGKGECMVEIDYGYEGLNVRYAKYVQPKPRTTVTLDNVESYQVKVKEKKSPVRRTARVLGWEESEAQIPTGPTPARINAAAAAAGVDENTGFELIYQKNFERSVRQVFVEFVWEDM